MASEMSLGRSTEHMRSSSGSGSRLALDEETIADESGRRASRPGIPRSHNYSLSLNQSQIWGASFHALRIPVIVELSSKARNGIIRILGGLERSLSPPRRMVQKSSSANSLSLMEEGGENDGILLAEPVSAVSALVGFEGVEVDPDEEEYGEVIERVDESVLMEQGHVGESSMESLSDHDKSMVPSHAAQDFPFSNDQSPTTDILDEQLLTIPSPTSPQPAAGDNRLCGDSINIMSTDGSANLQLCWSSTTATSSVDSGTMMTPATSHFTLPRIFHELFGLSLNDKEWCKGSDQQQ